MRTPPRIEIAVNPSISVLSISPFSEDHLRLEELLGHSELQFLLHQCATVASTAKFLRRHHFAVVVCECDLTPGSWRDVLAMLSDLPLPPSLIVTSRLADERKWTEILNLGAYDLLEKPFRAEEVCRVVNGAWNHWSHQQEARTEVPQKIISERQRLLEGERIHRQREGHTQNMMCPLVTPFQLHFLAWQTKNRR